MSAICTTCTSEERTVEFPSLKELNAHIRGGHKLEEEAIPVNPQGEVPTTATEEQITPLKPRLELRYQYVGKCTCERDVDTIEMNEEKSDIMIAYCSHCKIKWSQTRVVPLHIQKDLFDGKLKDEK